MELTAETSSAGATSFHRYLCIVPTVQKRCCVPTERNGARNGKVRIDENITPYSFHGTIKKWHSWVDGGHQTGVRLGIGNMVTQSETGEQGGQIAPKGVVMMVNGLKHNSGTEGK